MMLTVAVSMRRGKLTAPLPALDRSNGRVQEGGNLLPALQLVVI
jgi:hypothetical protein